MVNQRNPDLMSMLSGQNGQDQGSGGQSCNCSPILSHLREGILMLAEALDNLADEFHTKFGTYDQKTDTYQQVVDGLMQLVDEEIHEQEMGEFESKYGGMLGDYGQDWDILQSLLPEDKRRPLKTAMFDDLHELKNRKDYNDEMPGQYINDKLGMLKGVREKYKGMGGAPNAVKMTSVEAAPGPEQPLGAKEGAAFDVPKKEQEFPMKEEQAKKVEALKEPPVEKPPVEEKPSPKEEQAKAKKPYNDLEVDEDWLKEKQAKAAEVRRLMAERKKKVKK
jgi:hypothetical protein